MSTPKSCAGRYRASHFSRSVRFTANRGLITPQLLMLPTRFTRYKFPRPSSTSSNERMYSLSCITLRTRPMSFDAGRRMHSVLPAASALRIVAMASLSASCNIVGTSTVLPEAELVGDLAEALAAQVETVPSHDAALPAAAEAPSLPTEVLRSVHSI